MAEGRRRSFVPVAGLGVGAAGLGALAGSRAWVGRLETASTPDLALGVSWTAGTMPAASAAALVLLAAWGVLLVTRGRVRRGVAGLVLLAALGLAVAVVVGRLTLLDAVHDARSSLPAGTRLDLGWSPWFWAAALAAAVGLVTGVLALAWCRDWPEMGRRYDAPGAGPGAEDGLDPAEASSVELWKALDEGRDPTR